MQAGWSIGETRGGRDRGGGWMPSGLDAWSMDQQTKRYYLQRNKVTPNTHAATTLSSSHIIQSLSNGSSLVGCSPVDRDNKEMRVNNTQAASTAVGGVVDVEQQQGLWVV